MVAPIHVMLKRRNIRETAIQFLYFHDLQGGIETAEIEESFWEITQETNLKKHHYARAKAILHVAQGRYSRLAKLIEQAPAVLATLKATPNAEALVSALKKVISEQKLLSGYIDDLKTATKTKGSEDLPVHSIQEVIEANKPITASHQRWHETILAYPQLQNKMEAITAAIKHLDVVSQRLESIEDPDSAITDFAHLRASHSEIAISRQTITELVDQVREHQEDIDRLLADTIENYQPERVDLVDRAILRLAVYEMNYCEDIPRSVSINEAIEIAKRFSTTESSRFINGVLDSIK